MVSIARNDVVSSKKVFSRICLSILGKHDDLLVNLGSSILETLVSTEKNQVSEVVAKKSYNETTVVYEAKASRNVKFEGFENGRSFLDHITTDTIFALNSIVHNFSSESLLEMLKFANSTDR